MRFVRLAGLVLTGHMLVGLVLAGVPASAQYPPTVGNGRVSRSQIAQCQCTQFHGDGFAPGTDVTVTDNGELVAVVTANDEGNFTVKVCYDGSDTEGDHLLEARGTNPSGGEHLDRATVNLSGSACKAGAKGGEDVQDGGLARTGAVLIVPGLLLGFALVASGSLFVFLSRRRRAAAIP